MTVIQFPGPKTPQIEQEAIPAITKPVAVTDSNAKSVAMFGALVSVLKFYAGQGFDHGKQARQILQEMGILVK